MVEAETQNAPENNPAAQIIRFIDEVRHYIIGLVLALLAVTVLLFFFAPLLLDYFQDYLHQDLAYFTVAEPFLARVELALISAVFVLLPVIALLVWTALSRPFKIPAANRKWFVLFTCVLFYSGAWFCFKVTLPFGVKFLLGYQTTQLKALIAVGKFVTFVAIFLLGFGIIFELPIFMVFAARAGLISRQSFEKNRRYAILIISIVAALLTPTPDVVNMMLMGAPLYLLYELGIITLKLLKS
jgi:sec-independent protein translocase protein TatC